MSTSRVNVYRRMITVSVLCLAAVPFFSAIQRGCHSDRALGFEDLTSDPYWNDPLAPQSVVVASADHADLPFTPDPPDGLERPVRILTSAGEVAPPDRWIVWLYGHSLDRRFFLQEHVVEATRQRVLESEAARCEVGPSYAKFPGFSMITLRGGSVRALLVAQNQTTITWVAPLTS